MKDTCNTIVDLAREILASERASRRPAYAKQATHTQKTPHRETMISAFMRSTYCQPIIDKIKARREPAEKHELFEIKALIFYTARLVKKTEKDLEQEIKLALSMRDLTKFTKYDYEILRRYLHDRAS